MLDKESYVWSEVLGRDDPRVQSLIWAARDPKMRDAAGLMLRNLVLQEGWDPDDPPKFHLPRGISPSHYAVGTAVSGDVRGEEIGPSETDLDSHVGVFGMTSVGKTTLVKLLLVLFTKRVRPASEPKRRFFVWDFDGEYRSLLPLYEPDEAIWLTPDDLSINPLQVPIGTDGRPVMAPDKWINNIREWLRLLWLNEPSLNLFCEVLREEYRKRGILGDGNE